MHGDLINSGRQDSEEIGSRSISAGINLMKAPLQIHQGLISSVPTGMPSNRCPSKALQRAHLCSRQSSSLLEIVRLRSTSGAFRSMIKFHLYPVRRILVSRRRCSLCLRRAITGDNSGAHHDRKFSDRGRNGAREKRRQWVGNEKGER